MCDLRFPPGFHVVHTVFLQFPEIAGPQEAGAQTVTSNIVKFLQYEIYFIHTEYSLKIHWARLRPLPQCERNLGYEVPWFRWGPGNLRLDSGSLPAGWFPLPDAVRGLLGCHPSVPPLSVFVDLRAALGHVGCCARNMRAVVGDRIVTSTVRIKPT